MATKKITELPEKGAVYPVDFEAGMTMLEAQRIKTAETVFVTMLTHSRDRRLTPTELCLFEEAKNFLYHTYLEANNPGRHVAFGSAHVGIEELFQKKHEQYINGYFSEKAQDLKPPGISGDDPCQVNLVPLPPITATEVFDAAEHLSADNTSAKVTLMNCPNDTNGDGDCGRSECPYCGHK